jgi:hypothetical protein
MAEQTGEHEERLKSHDLYPLWQIVRSEQKANNERLNESDFKDENELDYRDFLEYEAKNRLSLKMGKDLGFPEVNVRYLETEPTIKDEAVRKEYEGMWTEFITKVEGKNVSEIGMTLKLYDLFDAWKKADKEFVRVPHSDPTHNQIFRNQN